MIRVTVQIEDGEDESRSTVISSAFETFDELEKTKFLKKARVFEKGVEFIDDGEECIKKKKPMGFILCDENENVEEENPEDGKDL